MSIWKEGLGEMWGRYKEVWKSAWDIREQLDPPKRDEDERAFLPAHLELIETPVSAAPKWTSRLIISFFCIVILWAIFGKIDVVASTQGKTVLSGRSKAIKSLEDAGVDKIYVDNGMKVTKGQKLVDLYFQGAEQDYEKSHEALKAYTLTLMRSEALLKAVENVERPNIDKTETDLISSQELQEAEALVVSQYQFWYAQDEKLAAAIRQRMAEYTTISAQVTKLEETIKIAQEQVDDYEKMMKQKSISKHAFYEKKQNLINYSNELESQKSRLVEIRESMVQHEKEKDLITYQLKMDLLDTIREAKESIVQFIADKHRAEQRLKQAYVRSPVAGTVQQLAIHTEGGVVSHAETLMIIVPEEDYMEVEVMVPNKDIGFIEENQSVVVKIESFPYTRYGYLTGKVKSISFDAIEHEDFGLVYQAIIKLDKEHLVINDREIPLTAGMNVTAEIKIRDRRVISYFLSPLQTRVEESLREL